MSLLLNLMVMILLVALLALFVDLTTSSHVDHIRKPNVDHLPVETQVGQ